jgi:hypothetical protein
LHFAVDQVPEAVALGVYWGTEITLVLELGRKLDPDEATGVEDARLPKGLGDKVDQFP